MTVSAEQAQVWRGGGRRWFSKMAACRAEARAMMKKRCECDPGDEVTPGYACHYHGENYPRIVGRLARHIAYNLSKQEVPHD